MCGIPNKATLQKRRAGQLELYEYDAGELEPEDVEVQVDYCGLSRLICR